MNKITQIGINRCKTISIVKDANTSKSLKAIFLTELAKLGYKIQNSDILNDSVFTNFDLIINTLTAMKGGDVSYVPLFSGFPNNVPSKEEFLNKRILGFFGNVFGIFDETDSDVKVLENGLIIPNWLFDLTEFGADPILGRQTKELFEQGLANQLARKGDKHTEFIKLSVSDDIESVVLVWMLNTLYSKSSIKEAIKEDLEYCINYFGLNCVDSSKVVFSEIKAYLMKFLWNNKNYSVLANYVKTSTDFLRMFAALTNTDISLAQKIKFPKFSRFERKFILENLEKSSNLVEDLNRYKGLWLDLGRFIHPTEYAKLFPKTAKAFDILRNSKVETFNSKVEKSLEEKDLTKSLELLISRPGLFAKKLHEVLISYNTEKGIVKAFKTISNQIQLKNLLILEKYFETINSSENRTIINKNGKVLVLPNKTKNKLTSEKVEKVVNAIKKAIEIKISENPVFEENSKVWIDSDLRNYMIPLSLRKQSDGLINIARGSRIKFDKNKTLRLFSYWKEKLNRTDYDSSLIQFDENMNYKGHVSYTNLQEGGIRHSGDMTSSEEGACEFMDIDLKSLKSDVKYLAIQTYRFAGESFSQCEKCYGGWMMRDKVNVSRTTFDIKTVANKFNVVGSGPVAMPMLVDVEKGEIIYIDLYMAGRDGSEGCNRVEGAVQNISQVARELVNMYNTKPNMYDLMMYHLNSSKAILTENKEEADITFGIDECTYNIDRVDEILSKFL